MRYNYEYYLLSTHRRQVLRTAAVTLGAFLVVLLFWDWLANLLAASWQSEWLIDNVLIVPAWPMAIIAGLATLLAVLARRLVHAARERDTTINVELIEVRDSDVETYRLRLRNWGSSDLERCIVRIDDFVASSETALPSARFVRGTFQPDTEPSPIFSLRSGEDKDIPLCWRRRDADGTDDAPMPIELACGGERTDTALPADRRYRLLLGIYGAPHPTIVGLEVGVDADNQLLVAPI